MNVVEEMVDILHYSEHITPSGFTEWAAVAWKEGVWAVWDYEVHHKDSISRILWYSIWLAA